MAKKPFDRELTKAEVTEKAASALREYGYESCTASNVFTDPIYSSFALPLLNNTLDEMSKIKGIPTSAIALVKELIEQCEQAVAEFLKG